MFGYRLNFLMIVNVLVLLSCNVKNESPIATQTPDESSLNLIESGDIIVANVGNDTIMHLDSDGGYKGVLVDSQTDGTLIYNALTFDSTNNQILFNHDSTTAALDSVKSIALLDGSVSTVISNSNLNGILPSLARLTGGELLIVEGTTVVERFLSNGTRSGAPFVSGLTASVADLAPLSTGGFVTCSSGTANTVRTYDAGGAAQVPVATSSSPVTPANPTLGALASTSCIQDSSGQIIVAYSGATDAVRAYDSTLSAPVWTFIDANVLTTPGKLAIRSNGNILITDTAFHHIVEISPSGALVGVIGGTVLSTPTSIVVVP